MDRIESIVVLLEAEARKRVKSRNDHDFASAVYEVDLEVSKAAMTLMAKYRAFQRKALEGP